MSEEGAQVSLPQSTIAEFGAMVRQWRRAAKLTQVELAKRSGISKAAIANIEAGNILENGPRVGTVAKLLEACGKKLILNVADISPKPTL